MIWGLSNQPTERAVRDSLARELGFDHEQAFLRAYPQLGIIRIRLVMNDNGLLLLSTIF